MTIPLTTKRTIPFTPASIKAAAADDTAGEDYRARCAGVNLELRVPSYVDRDEQGLRLYRMGVRAISTEHIRAVMMSEAYTVFGEEKGEAEAQFLEGHWQNLDREEKEAAEWIAQEVQRQEDAKQIPEGEEIPAAAPPPEPLTTRRDRARMAMLLQSITKGSQTLRDDLAAQQEYSIREAVALARLHVKAIQGLPTTFNISGGLATEESIEALREELAKLSHAAWTELVAEIQGLYNLPEIERGNSVSPPVNTTEESGSQRTSGESGDNAGSIQTTGSNIEPTPAAASDPSTATSSSASPASEDKTEANAGQTVEA